MRAFLLAFRQDLRRQQNGACTEVKATGQFMLIRRRIYEAVGGHAAVAGAICEDVALARLVSRSGGNVAFLSGDRLLSTRMYTGWRTLWPGIAKNLVEMLAGACRRRSSPLQPCFYHGRPLRCLPSTR